MIDETKFDKLEKEDLEAVNGGVSIDGVEYQYAKGYFACMDTSKFKPGHTYPSSRSCEYCIHFHSTSSKSSYYAEGYCDAIIVS